MVLLGRANIADDVKGAALFINVRGRNVRGRGRYDSRYQTRTEGYRFQY